ncbi:MAG TPA: thioredoxin family protein [Thermotogota bacterium]|nr:thioredoxin family protein [Thermotogota bacterium]HRW92284.1 thioredoxin family protein [Thermotogota bacterium]
MALLKEKDKAFIRDKFEKELENPVKVVVFLSKDEKLCHYCNLTKEILDEVAHLSGGKVLVEVHDFDNEKELAASYHVERVPGFVLIDSKGKDNGILFSGAPLGHEFATLLEELVLVSANGNPPLKASTIEKLQQVDKPVKIQVFVTPSCPYCPGAVIMGHYFAMVNPLIQSEMVEATEFEELSRRFQVSSVPKIVINEGKAEFVGALPEEQYLGYVLQGM